MGWREVVAGGALLGAAAYVLPHEGVRASDLAQQDQRAQSSVEQKMSQLGSIAGNAPREHPWDPGVGDKKFCLDQADHWAQAGMPWGDDSECQGQSMAHWRGHDGQGA